MNLNVYISGTVKQMQRLDVNGKVISVRPATDEEVWLFNRLKLLEGEAELLADQCGALQQDLDEASAALRELKRSVNDVAASKTPMAGEHDG